MKKLLSLILCISIALFAVACNPDGGNPEVTADGKVIISIPEGWKGGVGVEGVRANADLFEADPNWGNKPYGKYTGVKIEITDGSIPKSVQELKETTFDVVGSDRGKLNISELKDGLVNLNDLFQETFPGENKKLEDKLDPDYRKYFQDENGDYYAMPASQMHCGYALNTQLWERDQLYIAAAKVDGDTEFNEALYEGYHSYYSSKFGCTLYFSDYDGSGEPGLNYGHEMPNGQHQTSKDDLCVGPDGIAGTYDDGQPSSVIEFLTLCHYMEDEVKGITNDDDRGNENLQYYSAICYSGAEKSNYDGLFLDAFFASLAGENYETVLTLDSEGREVEVVVGVSNENLYPGINYIKKPITKKVKITPETGYYTTWMVEKYYTSAVMDILTTEDFFNYDFKNESSHIDAQYNFLIGLYENSSRQEACAYIFDGSYLNNEMRLASHLTTIQDLYDDATDIRMEFAVPPTSINDPVTCEEEGDAPVLVSIEKSFDAIPITVASDPDKLEACLAWLLYSRSDVAMARNFMYTSGFSIMLGDGLMDVIENNSDAHLADHEYFNYYKERYIEYFCAASEADRVMHPIGGEYFNPYTNPSWYNRGFGSGYFYPAARDSCFTYLLTHGHKKTFEDSMYTKNTWGNIYNGVVKDYTPDGETTPVVYNP